MQKPCACLHLLACALRSQVIAEVCRTALVVHGPPPQADASAAAGVVLRTAGPPGPGTASWHVWVHRTFVAALVPVAGSQGPQAADAAATAGPSWVASARALFMKRSPPPAPAPARPPAPAMGVLQWRERAFSQHLAGGPHWQGSAGAGAGAGTSSGSVTPVTWARVVAEGRRLMQSQAVPATRMPLGPAIRQPQAVPLASPPSTAPAPRLLGTLTCFVKGRR